MRLIDAELFKRQITGMAIVNGYSPKKANALCELIDNCPTAYDVGKVVEQLQDIRRIMSSTIETECFAGEECEGGDCTVCVANRAIKIVKGGGVG